MAMDVTFENAQGFIAGSTEAGVKMDGSKPSTTPPSPAPGADPEAEKRAFRDRIFPQPSQQPSGDTGQRGGGAPPTPSWPETPEQAQSLIDRLMASPKFRADYANQNNPERAKLVEGITQLYKLANPEPGEERQPESQVEDTPLQGLSDWTGVQHPDLGGVKYDEKERNWLSWVASENIPTATAQAMTEWYGTRAVLSGWAFREEDYQDFRVAFTGKLRPDQIETLIRWHKEEIMPAQRQRLERMRAQRAGERS